jgi:hypothetical protein
VILFFQSLADSTAEGSPAAGPWGVVPKITTPIMLLALLVVAWYLRSIAKLREETTRLEKLPEDRRFDLAELLGRKYGVPVQDLAPGDRVAIVHKELTGRRDHQRHVTWLLFAAFALAALLSFASAVLAEEIQTAFAKKTANAQQSQQIISLFREPPNTLFPDSICYGNPALPPADGCVALLGGALNRQMLAFATPKSPDGQRIRDATLYLHGLYDDSDGPKPNCISVTVDDRPLSDVDFKLDRITPGHRLSDENTMGTISVSLPRAARKRVAVEGRHLIILTIPQRCAATGYVAFRNIELVMVQD